MDYAWTYADATADAYTAKISEEFTRQQNLSTGLIGLGGLAIGLAAGHAHPDALKLTALTGGLGYQIGSLNTNQGRNQIYLAGAKAISCAKDAIKPLRIRENSIKNITTSTATLRDAAIAASAAAGALVTQVGRVPADNIDTATGVQKAQISLDRYTTDIAQANAAIGRAATLVQKIETAGTTLEIQVDNIRSTVSDALNGTVGDLSNLPRIIASTSDYVNVFAPGINLGNSLTQMITSTNTSPAGNNWSGGMPKSSTTPLNDLAHALGHLEAKLAELEFEIANLLGLIAMPGADEVKSAMALCAITPNVTEVFRLSTSTTNFTEGTAGVVTVSVKGGTSPYYAVPIKSLGAGIDVRVLPGDNVLVSVTADAKGGTSYQVNITDHAGTSLPLTITIAAKP
jgi:hypothetical protein